MTAGARAPTFDVVAEARPLTPGMRRLLVAATVLVALAGVQLYVIPERTVDWFAWTVQPPVTAAFLGAAYWASAAVELASARAPAWAQARVSVPGVFVFTALTLVVTLVHLDRFHLGADNAVGTRAVTIAWIAVYSVVPVLMAAIWWRQARTPGSDPPRTRPLPGWLVAAVALVAAVLLAYGSWLLVDPPAAATWWAWELTPLTGRAIGAWCVGLGVTAAQTVWEGDATRARPVAIGALALTGLAVGALARYPGDVDLGSAQGAGLVVVLSAWGVLGAVLLVAGRRRVP